MSKGELEAMLKGGAAQDTMVVVYAPWCQFCQGMEEEFEKLAGEVRYVSTIRAHVAPYVRRR